jgi:hypothetical protein
MSLNRTPKQGKVANNIQDLVPNKFFGITQRFVRQNSVITNNHCILQAAAPYQPVVEQVFQLLVKTKCPGVSEFFFPRLRRKFHTVELRESSLSIRTRAANFESLVRKQRHHRLPHFQFNGRSNSVNLSAFVLRHNSRLLDQLAVFTRTAVSNRGFICVQFNNRVVDTVACKRRQNVFNRVHFGVSLGQGGGTVVFEDVFNPSFDLRLAFKIHATKPDPVVGRRRQKGHADPVTAVQADPGIAGGAVQCLLL